ncbi:hypothetical protein FQR65_LT20787 [Abscondita terminalis]|nr:hypothetical protein FQR65_LT20787 [Abscondita terminalis]
MPDRQQRLHRLIPKQRMSGWFFLVGLLLVLAPFIAHYRRAKLGGTGSTRKTRGFAMSVLDFARPVPETIHHHVASRVCRAAVAQPRGNRRPPLQRLAKGHDQGPRSKVALARISYPRTPTSPDRRLACVRAPALDAIGQRTEKPAARGLDESRRSAGCSSEARPLLCGVLSVTRSEHPMSEQPSSAARAWSPMDQPCAGKQCQDAEPVAPYKDAPGVSSSLVFQPCFSHELNEDQVQGIQKLRYSPRSAWRVDG